MQTLPLAFTSWAATRGIARIGALAVVLSGSGCGYMPTPAVDKTVTYDDKGRAVVDYRICERLPMIGETACRTETVVHNYCYRSLGRVDCYENPQPGRTALRNEP